MRSLLISTFYAIILREMRRFFHQRSRFFGALVRPVLWLVVFGAGFRAALGVSIIPPYQTYIPYEVYMLPGLLAMIQLFNGMQSSLSMVYDRDLGSMRLILTSPAPRSWLLFCRLVAGVCLSLVQCWAFLAIAALAGVRFPLWGSVWLIPALFLNGMMLGALGLLLSCTIQRLENFAGVMNFVVFPLFFCSSALYPLYRMRESSDTLWMVCLANPFTHGVELLRFALYGQMNPEALAVVLPATLVFMLLSLRGYAPRLSGKPRP